VAKLKGTDGSLQEVDANLAARVSVVGPFAKDADGGRYALSIKSARHLAAFRNPSSTKTVIVDAVRIRGSMVTDFTTLQAWILALRKVTGYSALHNSGGAALPTAVKKRTSSAAAIADGYYANAAAAITGATVVATEPLLHAVKGEPSDGATAGNIPFEASYEAWRDGGPIILVENEGLLLVNEVLMGAAGTARVAMDIHWREVLNASAAGL
jgi:hypothetical protein